MASTAPGSPVTRREVRRRHELPSPVRSASHVATNSTPAGMAPPTHVRRTEARSPGCSRPLTIGAAKVILRPARESRWIEVAIRLTLIPHLWDEDQNCCMLRSVGWPPHQRPPGVRYAVLDELRRGIDVRGVRGVGARVAERVAVVGVVAEQVVLGSRDVARAPTRLVDGGRQQEPGVDPVLLLGVDEGCPERRQRRRQPSGTRRSPRPRPRSPTVGSCRG